MMIKRKTFYKKHNKRTFKRVFLFLLSALMLAAIIPSLSASGIYASDTSSEVTADTLKEDGCEIGLEVATPADGAVQKAYPKADIKYYESFEDGIIALQSGKISAFCAAYGTAKRCVTSGVGGISILKGVSLAEDYPVCAGISPLAEISNAGSKVNEFISIIKADGTLADMEKRWVDEGINTMPDIKQPSNPTMTVRIGTTGTVEPYSYYKDSHLVGMDIEFAYRFAAWMNAKLEISVYDWAGLISACQAGNVDYVVSELFPSEERNKAIDFSDTIYTEDSVMVIKTDAAENSSKLSYQDFNGKKIGVMTGSIIDQIVTDNFPDSKPVYYESRAEVILALQNGKIDAFVDDYPTALQIEKENNGIEYIDEAIETTDYAYAFPKTDKGKKLCAQMNAFLREKGTDGTLSKLVKKWVESSDEKSKTVDDYSLLPADSGTIKMVVNSENAPFCYLSNGKLVGYDMDLVIKFCKEYGYGLTIEDVTFSAIIPGLASAKYDIAGGSSQ